MDEMIAFGEAVKMDKSGLCTGYLVRFGDPENPDLAGDFFTPETDFGRPFVKGVAQPLNLYYAHGLDPKIGRKAVGTGTVTMDEVGLWFEAQIAQSDAYRKKLARLAAMKCEDGTPRLGYSSGAAAHLVESEPVLDEAGAIKANRITCWPLAEGSLTPRPSEPKNIVVAKSIDVAKHLKEAAQHLKRVLWEDEEDVATRMTMAILQKAHDRLYGAFYDVICYQVAPREQRLAALEEALDEFEDICLRYARAVLMGTAPEMSSEAAEGIKALRVAVKAISLPAGTTPAHTGLPDADAGLPDANAITREQMRADALRLDVTGLLLSPALAQGPKEVAPSR